MTGWPEVWDGDGSREKPYQLKKQLTEILQHPAKSEEVQKVCSHIEKSLTSVPQEAIFSLLEGKIFRLNGNDYPVCDYDSVRDADVSNEYDFTSFRDHNGAYVETAREYANLYFPYISGGKGLFSVDDYVCQKLRSIEKRNFLTVSDATTHHVRPQVLSRLVLSAYGIGFHERISRETIMVRNKQRR